MVTVRSLSRCQEEVEASLIAAERTADVLNYVPFADCLQVRKLGSNGSVSGACQALHGSVPKPRHSL